MKNNEFRLPLIQSVLVLVVLCFLIAFVAASDATSFFGGIASMFSGTFNSIRFAVALALGLVISIGLLVAIFFGAIALYSPDVSQEMLVSFRHRLFNMIPRATSKALESSGPSVDPPTEDIAIPQSSFAPKTSSPQSSTVPEVIEQDRIALLKESLYGDMEDIGREIKLLQEQNTGLRSALDQLSDAIPEDQSAEILLRTEKIEFSHEEVSAKVAEGLEKIGRIEGTVSSHAKESGSINKTLSTLQSQVSDLSNEIQQLKSAAEKPVKKAVEARSTASEEFRIFSYLEKTDDQEQFTKLIQEAVAKNMTYSEIDEFLSESLSKKIDTIVKKHPSLTKDYIRECRKI